MMEFLNPLQNCFDFGFSRKYKNTIFLVVAVLKNLLTLKVIFQALDLVQNIVE